MNDAGLDRRLGKDREDGLGKTIQPIDDGEKHILDAPVLHLGHHPEPELAPSFCSSQRPRISFVPYARTPKAMWTALLRTKPSSQTFTRRASKIEEE